jgi:hypothetical protein
VVSKIFAPRKVAVHAGPNRTPMEQISVLFKTGFNRVAKQRKQRPAQPLVGWNVETDFLPLQYRVRETILHQTPQDYFLLGAVYFEFLWETRSKLDDTMV